MSLQGVEESIEMLKAARNSISPSVEQTRVGFDKSANLRATDADLKRDSIKAVNVCVGCA